MVRQSCMAPGGASGAPAETSASEERAAAVGDDATKTDRAAAPHVAPRERRASDAHQRVRLVLEALEVLKELVVELNLIEVLAVLEVTEVTDVTDVTERAHQARRAR